MRCGWGECWHSYRSDELITARGSGSVWGDHGTGVRFFGILRAAITGQHITATTMLHVTSTDAPVPGGGTANTAFLKGGAQGPNAVAANVNATFWLETLQRQSAPTQLQHAQTVLLNFNGLSWPHITVATLHKA